MSVPLGRSAPHLCAPRRRCALGQAGLAVWFDGPHMGGAAKPDCGAPLLAAARRRLGGGLTDFYPPLAAICSDVMACLDHYFLSTSDGQRASCTNL
jgi:hypothetical protein